MKKSIPYSKGQTAVTVSAPKSALSPAQQTELDRLENVIKSGWKTFLEVGEALAQVRDKQLYKAKYDKFEDYWRIELGYSRSYAYKLIASAEVNEQLSPIGDFGVKPLNEGQLRELISVPEEKRAEAWKSAVKLAGDAPLTAQIVHKAAQPFKSKKIGKAGKAKVKKPGAGKRINLGPALKLLDEATGLAKENDELLIRLKMLRGLLLELAAKEFIHKP